MKALALALLAAAAFGSPDDEPSATERYRGRPLGKIELHHEGTDLPEASRALVELVEGEAYRPEAVRRSIKQLFALGAFSDIKVEAELAGEAVDLVFHLYPRIEVEAVELRGLSDPEAPQLQELESRLLDESRLRAGDPFDVEMLGAASERIREALHEEGFLWASVEPEASFQSPLARVVFHVDAGVQARVRSLTIGGALPHIEAHVRREIGLSVGGTYSRAEVKKRIAAITAGWKENGFYGAAIELEEQLTPEKLVDVRLTPRVGPRIRVEVQGGDFSEKEIRKLVPLFEESRFTEDLVEESRHNLELHLNERGYRDARVTVERETLADGHYLLLRFLAKPGTRFEVVAIELEGLESVPEEEVRSLLVTKTRRRVRSAPFRPDVWEDDLKEVRTYMKRQGFHGVQVEGQQRLRPESPGELTLVVRVQEGPRAIIDSVQIEGASELTPAAVLEASGLRPGAPFDASDVVEAREHLVNLYRNEGFRGADVEAHTTLSEGDTKAAISFRVREGDRTRIDRVILSGLRVSRESAVRRLVTLASGDPLSPVALLATRQKLVGSGLFRRVDIEVLPTDPVTLRSDVLISLEEGPRTSFAYGFGYEEQQLARAEIEVTRRNLFGLNRTVSVFTRASFRGGRFITTYRQPDTLGVDLPLFVSLFAEEEQRTSFDFNRVGVGLQFSKRVSEDQNLFLRYRFDRTKVFGIARDFDISDIDRRFRNVFISALSAASVTDRRDDPLNPARGQFRILDAEWSTKVLGSRSPYLRGLVQQFLYRELPHGMVAAVGFRLGVAQSFGDVVDPTSPFEGLIPITERFFAGGATTLRGFALDEASPKRPGRVGLDEQGNIVTDPNRITEENVIRDGNGEAIVYELDPVGGNALSLVNAELRFPILGNLRGVVFSDNGTVYPRLEDFSFADWRYNVGFGFRYETPLGPLRVDYGFKLDRRTRFSLDCPVVTEPCREPLGRWHVSLGHAF